MNRSNKECSSDKQFSLIEYVPFYASIAQHFFKKWANPVLCLNLYVLFKNNLQKNCRFEPWWMA